MVRVSAIWNFGLKELVVVATAAAWACAISPSTPLRVQSSGGTLAVATPAEKGCCTLPTEEAARKDVPRQVLSMITRIVARRLTHMTTERSAEGAR